MSAWTPKKGRATPRAPQNVAAKRRSLDGRPLRRRLTPLKKTNRPWELAR